MITFYVVKDYETPEHAGANGFQLITVRILDETETDVTNKINQGIIFFDDEELKKYFSEVFKKPIEDIGIVE